MTDLTGPVLRISGYDLVLPDIVRAQGCELYDSEGRRFVDLEAGVWCAAVGHNHPRIAAVIADRFARTSHVGYRFSCPGLDADAAAILEIAGMQGGQCVLLSSGSEAVELAVKMAHHITGRPLQLTLDHAYLAAYGTAGTPMGEDWVRVPWTADGAACDLDTLPWDRIASFVFEPGTSGGLVKLPPRALVTEIAERVRTAGGLIAVDEVTTGMGRTGTWLGGEHYGLEPDLVALGKGLGNGYPVSAVAMTAAVGAAVRVGGFHYAQSHQNDPVAAAVAAAVIDTIREEDLLARSRASGVWLLAQLGGLVNRYSTLGEVRGRGLMIGLEFAEGVGRETQDRIYASLVARGYLCGFKPVANLLRIYPPLTIDRDDLEGLVVALDDTLAECEAS